MNVRFIGCLHFCHANMARYRGFQDEFCHDEYLIEQFNSVVTSKKDITYLLGDITMEKSNGYYQLDRLNGVKHVVLGNHDQKQHVRELLKYVEDVAGMIDYKGYTLTHCPIHPSELSFYRGNIHAHIHHKNKLEEIYVMDAYGDKSPTQWPTVHKYACVDAYLIDFKPKTLEELFPDKYESTGKS